MGMCCIWLVIGKSYFFEFLCQDQIITLIKDQNETEDFSQKFDFQYGWLLPHSGRCGRIEKDRSRSIE
jgi:hypothetical protein